MQSPPIDFQASLWPEQVAALCQPGTAPVDAVFDMDGTLLKEDLGDELVGWLLEAGHHPPSFTAQAPTHAAYLEATRGWDTIAQFELCALITEGLNDDEIDTHVRACLAARVPLRPAIVGLAQAMVSVGHRVWILTGSAQAAGRSVARVLGLDPDRVIGLRLERDHKTGRYGPTVVPPVTFGDGKVTAAHQRIGPEIGFTIGDSYTDLPLLRAAKLAVAVPSLDGRLGPLARQAGLPVRTPDQLGC